MTMTDTTQSARPAGEPSSPGSPTAPAHGGFTDACAASPTPFVKPTGSMTYVVQKGANIIPSWFTTGRVSAAK
jgi:hypothetical protein